MIYLYVIPGNISKYEWKSIFVFLKLICAINEQNKRRNTELNSVYKNELIDGFTSCVQIKDLKEGVAYVFRVRAQNKAGVGKASEDTEPVLAETKPGTRTVLILKW